MDDSTTAAPDVRSQVRSRITEWFWSQSDTPDKSRLGRYIAKNFLKAGDRFFAASGTTVCCATLAIMKEIRDLLVCTHSVPLMFFYIDLVSDGDAAPLCVVETLRGPIDPSTGVIAAGRLGKLPTTCLLFSPHGISKDAFSGNRDVVYLQSVLKAHTDVYILVTWRKFHRPGNKVVKYMGHVKKEIDNNVRRYTLFVPEEFPPEMAAAEQNAAIEILDYLEEKIGIVVHRVPSSY